MRNDITPHLPAELTAGHFMIVGEAPGADEVKQAQPFVGRSGKLLRETVENLGLQIKDVYITNVFWERPPSNDVSYFFESRTAAKLKNVKIREDLPSYKSRYIKVPYDDCIKRLYEEIGVVKPSIILTVGATAMWALTGKDKITEHRGNIEIVTVGSISSAVISTFHPAGVLRRRDWFDVFSKDIKLAIESHNLLLRPKPEYIYFSEITAESRVWPAFGGAV